LTLVYKLQQSCRKKLVTFFDWVYVKMADSLHNALSKFRDTILTAVALLEFELRDSITKNGSELLTTISTSVLNIEKKLSTNESVELMEIKPSVGSGNIVVPQSKSPALASVIAGLGPPTIDLDDSDEEDMDESELEDSEEEVEGIEVEDFDYKGTTYQRDADGTVYLDGEEVGFWNGKTIKALPA